MKSEQRQAHWEKIYQEKDTSQVSWFQAKPEQSLNWIKSVDLKAEDAIIDIGFGYDVVLRAVPLGECSFIIRVVGSNILQAKDIRVDAGRCLRKLRNKTSTEAPLIIRSATFNGSTQKIGEWMIDHLPHLEGISRTIGGKCECLHLVGAKIVQHLFLHHRYTIFNHNLYRICHRFITTLPMLFDLRNK